MVMPTRLNNTSPYPLSPSAISIRGTFALEHSLPPALPVLFPHSAPSHSSSRPLRSPFIPSSPYYTTYPSHFTIGWPIASNRSGRRSIRLDSRDEESPLPRRGSMLGTSSSRSSLFRMRSCSSTERGPYFRVAAASVEGGRFAHEL
jgi:hypothetical protein